MYQPVSGLAYWGAEVRLKMASITPKSRWDHWQVRRFDSATPAHLVAFPVVGNNGASDWNGHRRRTMRRSARPQKKKGPEPNVLGKLITNLNVPNSAGGKTGVDWREWLGRVSERLTQKLTRTGPPSKKKTETSDLTKGIFRGTSRVTPDWPWSLLITFRPEFGIFRDDSPRSVGTYL